MINKEEKARIEELLTPVELLDTLDIGFEYLHDSTFLDIYNDYEEEILCLLEEY